MDNLSIYNKVRAVPENAKKPISAGRLKGKTDINPMWRIKALTEIFGPCGFGWYVQMLEKNIIDGANGEKIATVDLALFIKTEDGWSNPIYGTGGSMLVTKEQKGLFTSDEAFKMSYTDAISVCCKMLGVGADVYWDKDSTKYDRPKSNYDSPKNNNPPKETPPGYKVPPESDDPVRCADCNKRLMDFWDGQKLVKAKTIGEQASSQFGRVICPVCVRKLAKEASNNA